MGEVSNPLSSTNHLWICKCCGEVVAKRCRITGDAILPDQGPLRYAIWEVLCVTCILEAPEWLHQYEALIPDFQRGGDYSDQLATLRAQFLYETELFLRSQNASQVNSAPQENRALSTSR